MIETIIFEEPSARRRFLVAPCVEERERYLFHLMRRGFGPAYLRTVSFFLLWIVEFLRLTTLRMVEPEEIERAALASAAYRGPDRRGVKATGNTTVRFPRVAKNWLRIHGRLAVTPAPVHPYEKEITDFSDFPRSTETLSPATIDAYRSRAKLVLSWLAASGRTLSNVSLNDVDAFFEAKRAKGWSLSTLASHGQALRAFFLHAEEHSWSPDGRIIYYVSERKSFFNVWGIHFDPATRKPEGEPFQVTTFDNPRLMVADVLPTVGLSLTEDKLVVTVAQVSENLWVLDNVDH